MLRFLAVFLSLLSFNVALAAPPSKTCGAAPSAPSFLTGTATSSSVSLSWGASSGRAITNYLIYRNGSLLATVAGSSYSYVNSGLSPATSFTYKVLARNKCLDTGLPASLSISTLAASTPTPPPPPAPIPVPGTFKFTSVSHSADSRIIYVSSFSGDDANSCLSEASPCKTLARGASLLRFGYPDHLLFKRGDVFIGEAFETAFNFSGRSAAEPMVIGAYGSTGERPYFRTNNKTFVNQFGQADLRHVYFMDLKIEDNFRNPRDPDFTLNQVGSAGFRILAGGRVFENILLEGLDISFFNGGFAGHGYSGGSLKNVRIRGNIIHDIWGLRSDDPAVHQGHNQGMYTGDIDGLLIEGNIFDHNGGLCIYNNDPRCIVPAGLLPKQVTMTWFDHHVYSDSGNSNVIVINNVFANGDGVQLRSGGVAKNNIFLRTVTGLTGGNDDGLAPGLEFSFDVENNFFLEGTDFAETSYTPGPRGFGVGLTNINENGARLVNNVFLRDISARDYGYAIHIQAGNTLGGGQIANVEKAEVSGNLVYNWRGGLFTSGTPGVHLFNVKISGNTVQNPNNNSWLATLQGPGGYDVVFSNNRYFNNQAGGYAFGYMNNLVTLPQFAQNAGEAGSTFARINVLNENANIQQAVLGSVGADYEQSMARLRQQSRFNYDSRLEPVNLIQTLRVNLGAQ